MLKGLVDFITDALDKLALKKAERHNKKVNRQYTHDEIMEIYNLTTNRRGGYAE